MAQLDTEKAQIVGVCHCHKSYLEPLRLLQAAADTELRRLEVKLTFPVIFLTERSLTMSLS
ncbi:hypothetical protein [Nostoc sp. 'Peltigera membranacea cyanobiont' 232]|uniref:hypothetical protein n=1 Tax=Nostoc sp. 'Peltigera membranacea cyanobiont' 232 TaxID=2014531 RepID=UPI00117EDC76|nr:hypothetical protein [Nostoc sp. 'Peltigera membranacea cyanobiont' 232]